MSENNKTVNIFALLGFGLLLVLAIWSTVQVAKIVPKMFGGDFSLPSLSLPFLKDKLELNVDKTTVTSGDPITLTWKLRSKKSGILSFSYACKPGFHFRLPAIAHSTSKKEVSVDTENYTVLPCNMPYTMEKQNKLILIPISDLSEVVEINFALAYSNGKEVILKDFGKIYVNPSKENEEQADAKDVMAALSELANSTTTTESAQEADSQDATSSNMQQSTQEQNTQTQTQTKQTQTPQQQTVTTLTNKPVRYVTVPAYPTSDPNGIANLQVRILSVGVMQDGVFVPKGTISPFEKAAVMFEVKNTGTKETGPWNYRADLPTKPNFYYASKWQPNLLPGAKATITLTFDRLQLGRVSVRVQADPYNYIDESNEADNTDTRFFTVVNYNMY